MSDKTIPLMQVRNLNTRFHTDEGTVHAVNGVSYNLYEGETLGVVGESGCGKSVHAMSIMRLIPTPPGEIYDGAVIFRGRDLLALPEDEMRGVRGKEIAMIFQDPLTSLNPVFTVGDQIMEALQLHLGMNKQQARNRAIELLEMVNIPNPTQRIDAYPHEFSGGMRQRVMIAMGLSCLPSVLIADEPTTALDVTIQAQIIELVKKLRQKMGMSIIWISHDLGVVAGIADTVQVMYAGLIIERAPVKDIYADPRHPYTLGLLKSLPRVDQARVESERLTPIAGRPPKLVTLPEGCPFFHRCRYSIPKCQYDNPPLKEIAPNHTVACHVDIRTQVPHESPAEAEAVR